MKTRIAVLFTLFSLTGLQSACSPNDTGSRPALETVARAGGDKVVARVSGTELFASDVDLAAQEQGLVDENISLPTTHEHYRRLLDELIDQRLLALDAESQGLNADREAKIRLAAARERILGNILVERHLQNIINETAIRAIYDEQTKLAARGDELRARHILVEDKTKAEELLKKIESGEDFAQLAKTHSIDAGSAEHGGDLGYFTQDMLNADFAGPVFKTAKGERLGPLKSEFGWHIAQVLDRRPAPKPSFETLKPKIANFMTFDAIQDLLTELRDNAEVVILDETIATHAPEQAIEPIKEQIPTDDPSEPSED